MEIVAPLRVEPVAAARTVPDETRVVEVALGDDRSAVTGRLVKAFHTLGEFLQDVLCAEVDDGMDGIKPQCIDMKCIKPVQRVPDEIIAYLVASGVVVVDRPAPRRPVFVLREIRPVFPQIVALRPEVVVNNVEDDRKPAVVACVNKPL